MRQTVRAVKAECTGCGACVSICPKQAISMERDAEGFLYPKVDAQRCVGCDLCEKRCPAGKPVPKAKPQILGAQTKDEALRRVSSSGGAFTVLARYVLAQGGVVFGAAFDEALHVEHVGAFDENELAFMRGSKYVQSDAADAVENAVSLLKKGIPVLFSGTPCQVSGLLAALGGKHTEKLLTVDFVCHGVPSPGVFASYLSWLEKRNGQRVTEYAFRDKRLGWKNFSAVAKFEDGSEYSGTQTDEPYLYGFLQNLYLRPSCHQCTNLRGFCHAADITLADLWNAPIVCPQRDDDTGLSMMMANTQKGRDAVKACGGQLHTFRADDLREMARCNPGFDAPAKASDKRAKFFKYYAKKGFDGAYVMKVLLGPGPIMRKVRRVAHLPIGAWRRLRAWMRVSH